MEIVNQLYENDLKDKPIDEILNIEFESNLELSLHLLNQNTEAKQFGH